MQKDIPQHERPKAMIPMEANQRGTILKGTLTSKHYIYPDVLVQFSKIEQASNKARIFLYPTVDQAERLKLDDSPFGFHGEVLSREGVVEHWKASEIWISGVTEFFYKEITFLSQPWGQVYELYRTTTTEDVREQHDVGFGWFVANTSFALKLLGVEATRDGLPTERRRQFDLSEGAIAYVSKTLAKHWHAGEEERRRSAYVIQVERVANAEAAKRDVDGLLILVSLASREESMCRYWHTTETPGILRERWRFGFRKPVPIEGGENPLLLRDRNDCEDFMRGGLKVYLASSQRELLDSAVHALLARGLTVETRIVRLFAGMQSALLFESAWPKGGNRPKIQPLYEGFLNRRGLSFVDLWPAFDRSGGVSLYDIRNAAVHGEVFTEEDAMSLSYAAENLQWMLERILLIALGWDFQKSSVSKRELRRYVAYDWDKQRKALRL